MPDQPEPQADAQEGGGGPTGGLRHPRVLVGFLLLFLLILVVFHGVLFPFLMAMFIAYLIEPLVAAFVRSRLFGIRWTRGPTLVLMYVLVLGGVITASSCAVASVVSHAKDLSRDVAEELQTTAERARFSVDRSGAEESAVPGFDRDVLIPADTRVVIRPHAPPGDDRTKDPPPPRVFRTLYDVVFHPGEEAAEVLLEGTNETVPPGTGGVGRILDLEAIRYSDGEAVPELAARLHVGTGESASGLEVLVERRLITPIVRSLEKAGFDVQPTELRTLVKAQTRGLGENLPEKVTRWGRGFVGTLALSIYEFILILMLTAFIVMDRRAIAEFFASLPPPNVRQRYQLLLQYVDRGLAGVIRGQLVICVVNGILTYVGLLLLGIPGAAVLALVAGFLSLIPIFGTILSSIPIVLIALTDGIDKGFLALGWILLIHLLEANLLNPLIMGSHARMHPVVIVFALLAGEHSFGVWGALLAVPTASIIQACFLYYRYEVEGFPAPAPAPAHGAWIGRFLGR